MHHVGDTHGDGFDDSGAPLVVPSLVPQPLPSSERAFADLENDFDRSSSVRTSNDLPPVDIDFEIIEAKFQFLKDQLEGGFRKQARELYELIKVDRDSSRPLARASLLSLLRKLPSETFTSSESLHNNFLKIAGMAEKIGKNQDAATHGIRASSEFSYQVVQNLVDPEFLEVSLQNYQKINRYFLRLANAIDLMSNRRVGQVDSFLLMEFFKRHCLDLNENLSTVGLSESPKPTLSFSDLRSFLDFLACVGLLLSNASKLILDISAQLGESPPKHTAHFIGLAGFLMLFSLFRLVIDVGMIIRNTFCPNYDMGQKFKTRMERFTVEIKKRQTRLFTYLPLILGSIAMNLCPASWVIITSTLVLGGVAALLASTFYAAYRAIQAVKNADPSLRNKIIRQQIARCVMNVLVMTAYTLVSLSGFGLLTLSSHAMLAIVGLLTVVGLVLTVMSLVKLIQGRQPSLAKYTPDWEKVLKPPVQNNKPSFFARCCPSICGESSKVGSSFRSPAVSPAPRGDDLEGSSNRSPVMSYNDLPPI